MSLLIQRGADLEKSTIDNIDCNLTPLTLAIYAGNTETVELLLKNGANVNATSCTETALHSASKTCNYLPVAENKILILLKYGADVDALDIVGETPLQCAPTKEKRNLSRRHVIFNKYILLKEVAKMRFEEQNVSQKNLEYIQNNEILRYHFEKCLEELKKMKNCTVISGTTLYDVLKMRWQLKKMIQLTKNKRFVAAYALTRKKEPLAYYGEHLDAIFNNALQRRDILAAEEKKLQFTLKNCLPDLVIRKLAQFTVDSVY